MTQKSEPATRKAASTLKESFDTREVGGTITPMPEEKKTRGASRYDVVIATIVGLAALCVSGYTAYMQRQQVRAAVWPILQFTSSNAPDIRFTLANKGVGPAVIRHVVVRVDNQPVKNWHEALSLLLGPGEDHGSESDMNGSVLAAGESMIVLAPFDSEGKPFTSGRSDSEWEKMNKAREHVRIEICYCSALGECWTLEASGGSGRSSTVAGSCRTSSPISFEQ